MSRGFMFYLLTLLCSLGAVQKIQALEVCGNYCGPTWCSGAANPECADENIIDGGAACQPGPENCVESMAAISGEENCVDECCKVHDACCGSKDRSGCNKAATTCATACMASDSTKSACAAELSTFFSGLETYSCGSESDWRKAASAIEAAGAAEHYECGWWLCLLGLA